MRNKYWVIGGEYTNTAFDSMVDGTQQVMGPFGDRQRALQVWQRLADETRSNCHARFTIAEETAR